MQNNTNRPNRKKVAPIVITIVVVLYILSLLAILTKIISFSRQQLAEDAGPLLPILGIYAILGIVVIFGVIKAMLQRMKEIDRGEEEEASKY